MSNNYITHITKVQFSPGEMRLQTPQRTQSDSVLGQWTWQHCLAVPCLQAKPASWTLFHISWSLVLMGWINKQNPYNKQKKSPRKTPKEQKETKTTESVFFTDYPVHLPNVKENKVPWQDLHPISSVHYVMLTQQYQGQPRKNEQQLKPGEWKQTGRGPQRVRERRTDRGRGREWEGVRERDGWGRGRLI